MIETMPPGSYLVTHYQDRQRGLVIQTIYYEDGRVESDNGQKQQLVCHFSEHQVEQAKAAIHTSGLLTAPEITAEGFYDTASYTYVWSLEGKRGQVTNWAYPARSHPAFDALDRRLNELEEETRQ